MHAGKAPIATLMYAAALLPTVYLFACDAGLIPLHTILPGVTCSGVGYLLDSCSLQLIISALKLYVNYTYLLLHGGATVCLVRVANYRGSLVERLQSRGKALDAACDRVDLDLSETHTAVVPTPVQHVVTAVNTQRTCLEDGKVKTARLYLTTHLLCHMPCIPSFTSKHVPMYFHYITFTSI